jgi:hypothetical protein
LTLYGARCRGGKLVSMKSKLIPELISAAIIGVGWALVSNHSHQKWHRLGRDVFLVHESQVFENLYSKQIPLVELVLIWALVALVIYAFYKGLAALFSRVLP